MVMWRHSSLWSWALVIFLAVILTTGWAAQPSQLPFSEILEVPERTCSAGGQVKVLFKEDITGPPWDLASIYLHGPGLSPVGIALWFGPYMGSHTLSVPIVWDLDLPSHLQSGRYRLNFTYGAALQTHAIELVIKGEGSPSEVDRELPEETSRKIPLCSEAFDFFGDSAPSLPRYGLQVGYDDLLEQMTRAVDNWETEKQGPKVFVSAGGEPVYAGLWLFSEGDPLEWMDSLPGQIGARIDLPTRFSFSPNPRTEEGKEKITQILMKSLQGQLLETNFAPAGSEAALAFSIAAKSRAVGHRLDPGEVLQLALNSTGGDLRRATLLAHNTLKSLGREGMAGVTGISPQKRFFDDYLAPIRETDNSGVWYHLFGTMYYQLETQNGLSLQTGARSMLAADAARAVYVPVTLARLAAQGFSTMDGLTGGSTHGQSDFERMLDRTAGMLEKMIQGGYSWDGTGWSGFANAAEQAYREIAGGRTPDPEKFCVNIWGAQLAQALWRRAGKGVPFQIVDSIRVNPFSNVAGDTLWIGGQDTGTVAGGDRLSSDPNDLMLPKLVFSGSPVDVMLEAEGVRLYFDQQAALMFADGEFPYPVQPYFAQDGYLGIMWLAPPVGPEPAVTFFGVADGDLHYAVVDPVAGEISTWAAPVRAGEELRWSPAEAPTGITAADRAMLITGDGEEVAPQVVPFSFDGVENPVTPREFPVTLLLLGAAIAVGLVLIGVSKRRRNRASRGEDSGYHSPSHGE